MTVSLKDDAAIVLTTTNIEGEYIRDRHYEQPTWIQKNGPNAIWGKTRTFLKVSERARAETIKIFVGILVQTMIS